MNKLELIKKAKDAYYNSGEPIMTDAEYDKLVKEVGEEEVGAIITGNIDRVRISGKAMKSLNKVHSAQEIVSKLGSHVDIIASIKCDGLSTRVIYEGGKLISANTRGNGIEGGDIAAHAKFIKGIPAEISYKERLVIDGESIIYDNDFDRIKDIYNLKSSRNSAAGALSTRDTSLAANYLLSFVAWDVIEGFEDCNSYSKKLAQIDELGFTVVPYFAFGGEYTIDGLNNEIFNHANECGIPCDGVVWRIDDIEQGKILGETAHHFNNAVAYKREDEEYETTLLDIELSIGRTGLLTPVAVFTPVETGNSVIERASLHNLSVMTDILGLYPSEGQKIWVCKKNEIIPQVNRAEKEDIDWDRLIKLTKCPVCGGDIEVKDNDGVITIWCANPDCEGKVVNKVDYFVSKHGLDIKGLSKATIEKLVDLGWINSRADIFNLHTHQKEWVNLPGFGVKSVLNILSAIENSKKTTFEAYLSSLGISLIGRNVSKVLAKKFNTYRDFRKAIDDGYDFSSLDGFGYEMNKALTSYDYTEADKIAGMLNFEIATPVAEETKTATNLVFVITGSLSRPRAKVQADIEAAGAKMGSSITGKTNYLVCNAPEDSAKYKAAVAKGIPIITEEELMNILKGK